MPSGPSEDLEGIQSVVLALRIIETLAESKDFMGVTELASSMEVTKSRIHRHLRTLVNQGYIVQSPQTERYKISSRVVSLGRQAAENHSLMSAARTPMYELRDRLGHACALGEVEPTGIRILTTVPGNSQIDVGVKTGSLLHFSSSAQGKIALAFGDEASRDAVLSARLPQPTAVSLTDPKRLLEQLEAIRVQGWASSQDEAAIGLSSLAAPIFAEGDNIVGTVAIVSLTQFIQAQPTDEQIDAVCKCGRTISELLN